MIQMGFADVMISGGSDSLCEVSFSGFNSLKLIDPEAASHSISEGRDWSLEREQESLSLKNWSTP